MCYFLGNSDVLAMFVLHAEHRDVRSGTTNDQVTPGNIGQLFGTRLEYAQAQADEGVFFVSGAGGETKVATVRKNRPSQVVFLVPAGGPQRFHYSDF